MAEYLAPGVYVEEYEVHPKPIAGVPTSTANLTTLAQEMRQIMLRLVPEWTDNNASDPGVTLIELMAWLADAMMYRLAGLPAQGQRAAHRATAALALLANSRGLPVGALVRPHFFTGRLPDAATLQMEQDYQRERLHLHNRVLHGTGIVEGLGIRVEADGGEPGGRVTVEPGYALDCLGRPILLPCSATIRLPNSAAKSVYISVRHEEILSKPVPSPEGGSLFSTIEEVCVLGLVDDVAVSALALARLIFAEGRWQIDGSFVPCRVRRAD